MTRFNILFVLLFITGLIVHCSVRAPEVTVTGEKTALENQVIGTYELIEGDTWMIASTRGSTQGTSQKMSVDKRQVLEAIQNRKFNKDDIDEFKEDGVLGENNHGFLEIRETDAYTTDEKYKRRVNEITTEENRDREIVYARVLQVNEAAAEAGQEKVHEIFSKLNHDTSEPGTWLQLADGTWVKKAKVRK